MGEGERLYEQRRRRFWSVLAWLLVLGVIGGFAAGFLAGLNDAREGGSSSAYRAVGTIGVFVMVLGTAYGSWKFFANVDEVEVADNLWASLIGFYVYALLFPAWWAMNQLGQVTEPNDWVIFAAAMIGGLAVYVYRKTRYS